MKLLKTYKKYSVKLLNMTKINNSIYILKTRLYIIGKGKGTQGKEWKDYQGGGMLTHP